jgi:hypothetical protein
MTSSVFIVPVILLLYITFNITDAKLIVFIEEGGGCTRSVVSVAAVKTRGPLKKKFKVRR